MKKLLWGVSAAALSLAAFVSAPATANAAVWTSLLEYKDVGGSTPTKAANPFGEVTINEIDPYDVRVTVTLFAPEVAFLNTGGPHDPFLFNMTGNYTVNVSDTGSQTFFNGGYEPPTGTTFDNTPFGYFTNKIGCCDSADHQHNGAPHDTPPPLVFTVHDGAGITFAGNGAIVSNTGLLQAMGTGDHFTSNSTGADQGGWWFSADLVDTNGNTFNVAARDAIEQVQNGVPEPATWGLMIMGFGGIGAVLRRRRPANALA